MKACGKKNVYHPIETNVVSEHYHNNKLDKSYIKAVQRPGKNTSHFLKVYLIVSVQNETAARNLNEVNLSI